MTEGDAFVTTAGRLQFKKILYAVIPFWSDDKDNARRLLKSALYACLEEANSRKLTSIAFPPVGIGRLFEYPVEVVAETMISTINDFLKNKSSNTLNSIVIIDGFLDTAKFFQKEIQSGVDIYYGKKGKCFIKCFILPFNKWLLGK